MKKNDLEEMAKYDFLEEDVRRYNAKMFRIWGSAAVILILISAMIEIFWPLPA